MILVKFLKIFKDLDLEIVLEKVELYALTKLCYKNMNQSISYEVIAKECKIPLSKVEALIIQGNLRISGFNIRI